MSALGVSSGDVRTRRAEQTARAILVVHGEIGGAGEQVSGRSAASTTASASGGTFEFFRNVVVEGVDGRGAVPRPPVEITLLAAGERQCGVDATAILIT